MIFFKFVWITGLWWAQNHKVFYFVMNPSKMFFFSQLDVLKRAHKSREVLENRASYFGASHILDGKHNRGRVCLPAWELSEAACPLSQMKTKDCLWLRRQTAVPLLLQLSICCRYIYVTQRSVSQERQFFLRSYKTLWDRCCVNDGWKIMV